MPKLMRRLSQNKNKNLTQYDYCSLFIQFTSKIFVNVTIEPTYFTFSNSIVPQSLELKFELKGSDRLRLVAFIQRIVV